LLAHAFCKNNGERTVAVNKGKVGAEKLVLAVKSTLG